MRVSEAKFIISAVSVETYPRLGLPEVAFVGRSNVGKSSLVNRIIGQKNLLKISSQPGKTQTINFFLINKVLVFVDLPGYGFAKVPESVRRQWRPMIEKYLSERKELSLVVQLVDLRHEPTELDHLMQQWLASFGIQSVLVATKADKVSSGQKKENLEKIKGCFPKIADGYLFPFSAKTGEGKQQLWKIIREACQLA